MSKGKWIKKDKSAEIAKERLEDKKDPVVSSTGVLPEQIKIVNNESEIETLQIILQDVGNCKGKIKDLESRVHEIECFRNPNALEGRIRDIGQQIEDIKVQIDWLKGNLKKLIVTEPIEQNPRIIAASQPGGSGKING